MKSTKVFLYTNVGGTETVQTTGAFGECLQVRKLNKTTASQETSVAQAEITTTETQASKVVIDIPGNGRNEWKGTTQGTSEEEIAYDFEAFEEELRRKEAEHQQHLFIKYKFPKMIDEMEFRRTHQQVKKVAKKINPALKKLGVKLNTKETAKMVHKAKKRFK